MSDNQWRRVSLSTGNGGWVCYRSSDLSDPVLVRFVQADDGRLEVSDLYVPFESAPDARHLRDVAAAASDAETWVNNDPETRTSLLARLDLPAPDLRTAAAWFAGTPPVDQWVGRMFASQVKGSDEPRARTPRQPFGTPPAAEPLTADFRLTIPTTRAYPDDFYQAVADVYGLAVTVSDRPAVEIAEANGVPIKTVHRWVSEARRRGHLAPGRKGRAG